MSRYHSASPIPKDIGLSSLTALWRCNGRTRCRLLAFSERLAKGISRRAHPVLHQPTVLFAALPSLLVFAQTPFLVKDRLILADSAAFVKYIFSIYPIFIQKNLRLFINHYRKDKGSLIKIYIKFTKVYNALRIYKMNNFYSFSLY